MQAIETSERIFAMKIRVMATILKTVDNLADAVASCSVCIEELHCLSAVQDSFHVLVKTGFLDRRQALKALKLLFSKEDQKKRISNICQVNLGFMMSRSGGCTQAS